MEVCELAGRLSRVFIKSSLEYLKCVGSGIRIICVATCEFCVASDTVDAGMNKAGLRCATLGTRLAAFSVACATLNVFMDVLTVFECCFRFVDVVSELILA